MEANATNTRNEDWVKTRTWDLFLGSQLVRTVPALLVVLGVSTSPLAEQKAAIRKAMELPSWEPAPAELKAEAQAFVGDFTPEQLSKAASIANAVLKRAGITNFRFSPVLKGGPGSGRHKENNGIEVPPELGDVPYGWEAVRIDENEGTITIASKTTDNVAKFSLNPSERSRFGPNWRFNEVGVYAILDEVDKHANGKVLDFANGTPSSDPSKGFPAACVSADNPNTIMFSRPDRLIVGLMLNADADDETTVEDRAQAQKFWSASTAITTTEDALRATVQHELGHSAFFSGGHHISDIYDALAKTQKEMKVRNINWKLATGRASGRTAKSVLADFRDLPPETVVDLGGKMVPIGDLKDGLIERGYGEGQLSDSEQYNLRAMGMTQYGSTTLQETVAEAHAMWRMPDLFPETPLTRNLAAALGWGERTGRDQ